jgi:8-oxo-dGTP diphosphatase
MLPRLAMLLCFTLLSACSQADVPPCPYQGEPDVAPSAGCLAVVHGRVLVIDSRKGGLSPPGGKTRRDESAQCAAHRETYEETGLDLLPRKLLRVFDTGFHLYYCEIHARSGLIEPGAVLEVRRGFWLPVDQFGDVQWRYPGQGKALYDLVTSPETYQ